MSTTISTTDVLVNSTTGPLATTTVAVPVTVTSLTTTTGPIVVGAIGPLTTIFTPPSSCTDFVGGNFTSQPDGFSIAASCAIDAGGVHPTPNFQCFPSVPGGPSFLGIGAYSPGFYCPQGLTTACAALATDSTGDVVPLSGLPTFVPNFPLQSGETAYGCCPSGLGCGGESFQVCSGTINVDTVTYLPCNVSATPPGIISSVVVAGVLSVVIELSTKSEFSVFAFMVQINRRAVDKIPTSTTRSINGSSTHASTASGILNSTNVSSSSTTGLSDGAKIGIGVGIGVGGLIFLVAFILFFLRYRSKRKATPAKAKLDKQPGIAVDAEPGVLVVGEKPGVTTIHGPLIE